MVYVQNPGSCHIKFCTFRHATVILQHLNSSIIENCEFSKTDSAAITVEGFPREDRNWTFNYMMEKIAAVSHLNRPPQKGYEMAPPSAFSTSTAVTQKWLLEKSSEQSILMIQIVDKATVVLPLCRASLPIPPFKLGVPTRCTGNLVGDRPLAWTSYRVGLPVSPPTQASSQGGPGLVNSCLKVTLHAMEVKTL